MSVPAPSEALPTIASVAVVAWTGLFILVKRDPSGPPATITLVFAMDALQTSFIGAIVAILVTSPLALAIVAALFFGYYAVMYSYAYRKWGAAVAASGAATSEQKTDSLKRRRLWGRYRAIAIAPLLVIAIFPSQIVAAGCCLALTFVGYQVVLPRIYGAEQT